MLLLLARPGLRCGEVARLQLDDIDWHAGGLLVRGKGGRDERLPLPERGSRHGPDPAAQHCTTFTTPSP